MSAITQNRAKPAEEPNGFGVYVIELGKGANRYLKLPPDLALPVVYVGQSWHTPEKRFEKHMEGGQFASKIVVRNGIRLRPDLYKHLRRVETKREAEALEARHAHTLAGLGFHAYFDNRLIRPERTDPTPESKAMNSQGHLEIVADYFDQSIFMAISALNVPDRATTATVDLVANLLGFRGAGNVVRVNVPIPAHGRFAYLSHGLIVGRIQFLLEVGILETTPDGHIFIPDTDGGLN